MNKKLLLVFIVFGISYSVLAQEENTSRYPSNRGFITNGFFDNIELSFGAGVQFYALSGYDNSIYNKNANFDKQLSPQFELALGKWLTPVWGGRVHAQGAWIYGFPNKIKSGVEVKTTQDFSKIKVGSDWNRHQANYLSVQFQTTVDLTAWIGGFNPKRIYDAVVFGGVGFGTRFNDVPDGQNPTAWMGSFGLSNRFKIIDCMDIYLDIASLTVRNDWYNPQNTDSRIAFIPSLSAGLNFRFKQRDFKRAPKCDYTPLYKEIDQLKNNLAEAQSEKNQLENNLDNANRSLNEKEKALNDTKKQLEQCENELQKKPTVIEKIIIQKPTEEEQKILKESFDAIYFNTGSSTLDPASFNSLNKVAEILKKYPNAKITVAGHTDNIGSEQANIRMSQKRADSVTSYLKNKGVKAEIKAIGCGSSHPVADNSTAEGRSQNRRTEITFE